MAPCCSLPGYIPGNQPGHPPNGLIGRVNLNKKTGTNAGASSKSFLFDQANFPRSVGGLQAIVHI
jgi:hypothetical protein